MLAKPNPEAILATALTALSADSDWRKVLDELPAPIYVTDTEGSVTYWNQACIELAGRVPQLGRDRWCVTWKIYTTTGEFMPHDECPMAQASGNSGRSATRSQSLCGPTARESRSGRIQLLCSTLTASSPARSTC